MTGVEVKSWFLAMYLQHRSGLAMAGISVLSGVVWYIRAVWITSRNRTILRRREAVRAAEQTDVPSR
jgi:hypothetical protein